MLGFVKNIFAGKQEAAPVTAPPMGELAATDSALYTGLLTRAYNPDILARRKGGLKVYDDMKVDDQVKASLALKKYAILAPGWTIEAAPDDANSEEIAAFIEDCFSQMKGTVNDFLLSVLTALDYGFSVNEIVWKALEEGDYKGKIGIAKIKSKKPHSFEFDIDEFSNLKTNGLIQTGINEKRLPPEKFIIYVHQKEFENWYGTSDLRQAYRNWWSKENLIRFWNIYLERYGSPTAIGKYKGTDPNAKSRLESVLSNLQSKTSITMREGDYDISLLEAQRRSNADYLEAITYHDKGIARSILIPDRLVASGETGAYSQSQTHFEVFLWVVAKLRQDLEESVMEEQVIRRLVTYNFGNDAGLIPKFKFNPLTEDQRKELATAFGDAVQKGAVSPTFKDENHIREILRFPEKTEEDLAEEQSRAQAAREQAIKAQESMAAQDVKAKEEEVKKNMADSRRELTTFEKRVNFTQIDDDLKSLESKTVSQVKEILTRQRDTLIAFIQSKLVNGKLTASMINTGIELKYLTELKAAFRTMFESAHTQGQKDALSEIPKQFKDVKAKSGIALKAQEAIDYLTAKTDFVVSGVKDPIVSDTKRVLLNTLKNGDTVSETVSKLQSIYEPYLADGSVITDGKQATSYRLETITRTNMSEAYNWGRRKVGDSSEGYVTGYQFSEILDDRTTDISLYVDGLVVKADSPYIADLTYPLHYNDRGVFVFVTKDDGPVEYISDAEVLKIIGMMEGFK